MKYTFHTCDVFTAVRFGGNPLAVVLGADGLCGDQMQCATIVRAGKKSQGTVGNKNLIPRIWRG